MMIFSLTYRPQRTAHRETIRLSLKLEKKRSPNTMHEHMKWPRSAKQHSHPCRPKKNVLAFAIDSASLRETARVFDFSGGGSGV